MEKADIDWVSVAEEILSDACEANRYRDIEIQQGVDGEKRHDEVVCRWVLKFDPHASIALQMAALLHDVDAIVTPGEGGGFKGSRQSPEYFAHKKAHAHRSAAYVKQVLEIKHADPGLIERVCFLITHHDNSRQELAALPDKELELLVAADSISWFSTTALKLRQIEGEGRVLDKARFMLGKAPPFALRLLAKTHLEDPFFERVKVTVLRELHALSAGK